MMLRHICLFKEAAAIENALLATLESGIHTGDFGSKSTPAVGTAEFTKAVVSNLGNTPKTCPRCPRPRRATTASCALPRRRARR